jgi:hypothetical protein
MRRDPEGLADFCDPLTGECYINQPDECSYDSAACIDYHSPGDPVAACVVHKVLLEELGIHEIAKEVTEETILHALERVGWEVAKKACKSVFTIVRVVTDAQKAYVIYKECSECNGSCPTQ